MSFKGSPEIVETGPRPVVSWATRLSYAVFDRKLSLQEQETRLVRFHPYPPVNEGPLPCRRPSELARRGGAFLPAFDSRISQLKRHTSIEGETGFQSGKYI